MILSVERIFENSICYSEDKQDMEIGNYDNVEKCGQECLIKFKNTIKWISFSKISKQCYCQRSEKECKNRIHNQNYDIYRISSKLALTKIPMF